MPTAEFDQRLEQLRSDLITQFDRVIDLSLRAVEAYFSVDTAQAAKVIQDDEAIDRVDVQIERASVPMLAMGVTDEHRIRWVLMIVKVNNELERIADCAVNIAEVVAQADRGTKSIPNTFRVMANSVVGMLRETRKALKDVDAERATIVLKYDETVDNFKREIGLDSQRKVADGAIDVGFAFRLRTVTSNLERMADHCTNICMQVIYLDRGLIVKHRASGWTEPAPPDLE